MLTQRNAVAHHPHRETQPVYPRIDVIPPLATNWPSYRERMNRPRYLGGKIMYHIEPTSQEAMSWHRSVHRGYYANHAPRMEDRYWYPKPWQALTVGPRVAQAQASEDRSRPSSGDGSNDTVDDEANAIEPRGPIESLPAPIPTDNLPSPTP